MAAEEFIFAWTGAEREGFKLFYAIWGSRPLELLLSVLTTMLGIPIPIAGGLIQKTSRIIRAETFMVG